MSHGHQLPPPLPDWHETHPPVSLLPDGGAILLASSHDHYVRNTLRPGGPAPHGWQLGEAVAWVGVDAEERTPQLSVLGPPAEAAHLLTHIATQVAADLPTTIGVAAVDYLRPEADVERRYRWRFKTIAEPPRIDPSVEIRVLPSGGDERVDAFLRAVGGMFSAWPGDPAINRWVVVEDGRRLLACAADTSGAPGVGHMGSVAVHPDARRQGLATAVVSWLTADLLTGGCDVVAIGVFVGETAAQRLYDRIGYRTEYEFFTGPRTHRDRWAVAGPMRQS